MKGFVVISASDLLKMPMLSESEMKAQLAKERAAYLKMLRELCPSIEMRRQAKRIANRNDSCVSCIYCDIESCLCHCPYSDWQMEDLNIDPCYDGVLRFLVKEAEEAVKAEKIRMAFEKMMIESPKSVVELLTINLENMRTLTSWIISMLDENWQMTPEAEEAIRSLNHSLNEVFTPSNCNSDGGGIQ